MDETNKAIVAAAIDILKFIDNPNIVKGETHKIIKLATGIEK